MKAHLVSLSLIFCLMSVTLVPAAAHAQAVSFSVDTISQLNFNGFAEFFVEDDRFADMNGDGREDFVYFRFRDCNGIVVRLSSGDAVYDSGTCYAVPFGRASSLTIGDFNRDGKLDVIAETVSGCANCFYEFLNDGGGRLQAPKTFDIGIPVRELAAGNVNHGCCLDLLLGTEDAQGHPFVKVMFGDGLGGFVSGPTSASQFVSVQAIADFDGDGNADVVVKGPRGPTGLNNEVLYGDGAGHFQRGPVVWDDVHHRPYDVNGDGKMDLIGARDNFIVVDYGNANRTLTHREISVGQCVVGSPSVGDFSGDGVNDLAVSESADCVSPAPPTTLSVLLGNKDGSYQPEQAVYNSDDHVLGIREVLRINPDRKPDLFINTRTIDKLRDVEVLLTNITTPFNVPKCDPPNRAVGFSLCSPTQIVSSSNSVRFSIAAANQTPGRKVELWVDGKKRAQNLRGFSHYSFLDTTLTLAPGTHRIGLFSAGWDNHLQKFQWTGGPGVVIPLTVGSSTCPRQGGIIVCSPINDASLGTSVLAWAVARLTGTTIARMEVWVDGVKKFTTVGQDSVKTNLSLSPGLHRFTYFAVGTNGKKVSSTVKATVK